MSDSRKRSLQKTTERPEREEKQFLKGRIRLLEKQLKHANREASRLRKCIRIGNLDALDDDDPESNAKAIEETSRCKNPQCKSKRGDIIEILDASGAIRRFFICKECGKRTRITEDGTMETKG